MWNEIFFFYFLKSLTFKKTKRSEEKLDTIEKKLISPILIHVIWFVFIFIYI